MEGKQKESFVISGDIIPIQLVCEKYFVENPVQKN